MQKRSDSEYLAIEIRRLSTHLAILVFQMMFCLEVDAMMPCGSRASLIQQGRDLVSKVSFYDNIKPESAEGYASKNSMTAAEVESRFSGTGIFVCENGWGNGQVIGNRKTIATVFHTFLKDMRDCDKPRALNRCAFIYQDNGKRIFDYARKIVATGGCSAGSKLEGANDWAIVELKNPLPNKLKPYEVPKQELPAIGQQITLVGRTSGFNPNAIKGDLDSFPQSYANCTPLGTSSFSFAGEIQSNCPAADGSSGSGVFQPGSTPVLAGLLRGDIATKEVCVPKRDPGSDDGPFQLNCRGSLIVPASGSFLKALQRIK